MHVIANYVHIVWKIYYRTLSVCYSSDAHDQCTRISLICYYFLFCILKIIRKMGFLGQTNRHMQNKQIYFVIGITNCVYKKQFLQHISFFLNLFKISVQLSLILSRPMHSRTGMTQFTPIIILCPYSFLKFIFSHIRI